MKPTTSSIRNLGSIVVDMTRGTQDARLSVRAISAIYYVMSTQAVHTLVYGFVLAKLDYCKTYLSRGLLTAAYTM